MEKTEKKTCSRFFLRVHHVYFACNENTAKINKKTDITVNEQTCAFRGIVQLSGTQLNCMYTAV